MTGKHHILGRQTMWKYKLAVVILAGIGGAADAGCVANLLETTPNTRFIIAADGTATDKATGLMWKRCLEGQTWDSDLDNCAGTRGAYTWQGALDQAVAVNTGIAGEQLDHTDWRVPNFKELASIIERACFNPSFNKDVFLGLPTTGSLWSSSPYIGSVIQAWQLAIGSGADVYSGKTASANLRLVRNALSATP